MIFISSPFFIRFLRHHVVGLRRHALEFALVGLPARRSHNTRLGGAVAVLLLAAELAQYVAENARTLHDDVCRHGGARLWMGTLTTPGSVMSHTFFSGNECGTLFCQHVQLRQYSCLSVEQRLYTKTSSSTSTFSELNPVPLLLLYCMIYGVQSLTVLLETHT